MYVRTLADNPIMESHQTNLKRSERYLFPYQFKILAWCIVFSIAVTSSIVLIIYGMDFGIMKTYLWLTGIIGSFFVGVFLTTPMRIVAITLLDALCLKTRSVLISKKILPSLLENEAEYEAIHRVESMRKYNQHLYSPIPTSRLQTRLEDIKYNLELRNITVDIIVHILFVATIIYVVLFNKPQKGYFSTETMKNLVVNGNYTNSKAFTEVRSYDEFKVYLNETLLPALLTDSKGNSNTGRSSRISDRGWTMEPALKLLGIPRLRQIRVNNGSCIEIITMQGRNLECFEELTLHNEERGNFTLEWAPKYPKGLTPMQKSPWIYRNSWDTQTLPIFAKFSSYPPGGYVLNLARDLKDARIVLDYMDEFKWVDTRTRAVFIEFTTYCVNANIFNVVTLIAEKSATGYIIPSYQIVTSKFVFLMAEVEIIFTTMTILFTFLLFFLLLRESLKIHRTSLKIYLRRTFSVMDLAVIFFGAIIVLSIILRSFYVSSLLYQLEESVNNEFVSFVYAAFWDVCSTYIEAILICLVSFKLFRLLTFRVLFFQLQTALIHCYRHFLHLVVQVMTVIIAFALMFYLTLIVYSYGFSTFALSMSTLIGRSVALDDNFDFDILTSSLLPQPFFALFIVFVTIIFMNLFIAVICLYFHHIRKISLVNKYNLTRYLKHMVTANRKRDILHLRDHKVLRLKGGGSNMSIADKGFDGDMKGRKERKEEEEKEKERKEEEENEKKQGQEKERKEEEEDEEKQVEEKERKEEEEKEKKKVQEKEREEEEYEDWRGYKKDKKKEREKEIIERLRCKDAISEGARAYEEVERIPVSKFLVKKSGDTTRYLGLRADRDKAMRCLTISILAENGDAAREGALKALFLSFTAGRRRLPYVQDTEKYFYVINGKREVFKESKISEMKQIVEELALEKNWVAEDSFADSRFKICPRKTYLRILNRKMRNLLQLVK